MHKVKIYLIILSIMIPLLIIAGGILSNSWLKYTSNQLLDPINQTTILIKQNQWEAGTQKYESIKSIWHDRKPVWSILIDHAEIDNINTEIAKLDALIEHKQKDLTLTELSCLKQFVLHIPNSFAVTVENIF